MAINAPANSTIPRDDLLGAYVPIETENVGFIAEQVLPRFEVARVMGTYGVIPPETFLQLIDTEVGPTAESPETSWSPDNDTFVLKEYRNKSHVTAAQAQMYSSWFDAEMVEAKRVRLMNQRRYEYIVAHAVINETTFPASGSTGVTLSTPWDNSAATPVNDVQTGIQTLVDNYGVEPNTLIISSYCYRNLKKVTQITSQLTSLYGAPQGLIPGVLPTDQLAFIFGVEKVLVSNSNGAVYNGAKPGATLSISKFWDEDYAFLARIEPSADLGRPQLGRTLTLAGYDGIMIDSWPTNDPAGSYVRATERKAAKLMKTPVGYLIKNTKT